MEVAYTFMEGLSIDPLKPLLQKYLGSLQDLAGFLDSFEDEEWSQDWSSFCQVINI